MIEPEYSSMNSRVHLAAGIDWIVRDAAVTNRNFLTIPWGRATSRHDFWLLPDSITMAEWSRLTTREVLSHCTRQELITEVVSKIRGLQASVFRWATDHLPLLFHIVWRNVIWRTFARSITLYYLVYEAAKTCTCEATASNWSEHPRFLSALATALFKIIRNGWTQSNSSAGAGESSVTIFILGFFKKSTVVLRKTHGEIAILFHVLPTPRNNFV